MLVLSRKQGEEIVIGEGVKISIVGVSGRRVKLAIDAPKEVTIQRVSPPATDVTRIAPTSHVMATR
ncbi:carbon storage regulator [Calycomorphotria hydatis]|uniref:Translational regulator CsrA n=1 Tax=Calycomorphotria hydatis TaxID=2528027 RepID=A0A517T4P6_9PLAN|nr:carbon storage regulator [Calycomorphotria hydatis]QDT63334.1 hypothetical protein V22_05550 [Calycomorphotria hydatis]